jgi:hypothetical protein
MIYFQTKNSNLGKFWTAFEWKRLVCYLDIWNIHITAIWYMLWPLANLVESWYISPVFVNCGKSGNPGAAASWVSIFCKDIHLLFAWSSISNTKKLFWIRKPYVRQRSQRPLPRARRCRSSLKKRLIGKRGGWGVEVFRVAEPENDICAYCNL